MSNVIDSIKLSGTVYTLSAQTSGGVPESTFTAYTSATDSRISEDEEVTAAALNDLNESLSGKADTATTYTKTEVDTALNAKQATLVSGTNIKTLNNESILGSGNIDIQGGSTYTAGRGISIANDTISFSLPISAGTGTYSVIEGSNTTASGNYSHAEGYNTTASGSFSHAEGVNVTAKNVAEHASGRYNNSVSASTTFGDSGNTLFSVGNGTAANVRHNAFEIRQNGDIYLSLNGQDVKLQDQLGGSSITIDPTLDSGSTNAVANSAITEAFENIEDRLSEDEEVTAAGLNALNDKFDGLKLKKLSQAEYDAMSGSTDANTLYVIVN